MKRDDFQRVVKPRRIEREIGDAPSLGHVDRVFGQMLPKEMLRKRRRGAGKRDNRDAKRQRLVVMTWSVVFAAIALMVVVVAVRLGLGPKSRNVVNGKAKTETSGNAMREASRFPSPSKEAALDLVKRALLIRDPGKVTELFRVDSATPAEIVVFFGEMLAVDGPITGYQWLGSMDANGLLIDGVLVNTRIGNKRRSRLALLTPDDKGRWRMDFGAFARAVTPSWGEILSGSARQGTVRTLFTKDNYFNGPFGDEAQWTCYRLGSPDLTDDLLGYCRKNSPQAAAMKLIMTNAYNTITARGLFRAILQIRRTEGAEARQFEITRVVAEDWIRTPESFDKSVD